MIINNNGKEKINQDYSKLINKPKINGHELVDNLTSEQLGIENGKTPVKGVDYFTESEITEIENNAANKVKVPTSLSELQPDDNHQTVTSAEKKKWNSGGGGSGGGTLDYNELENKPKINSVELKDDLPLYEIDKNHNLQYAEETYFDAVVAPDKYNTGLSNAGACNVVLEANKSYPEYQNLKFFTDETGSLFIDFNDDSAKNLNGIITLENIKFDKVDTWFGAKNISSYAGQGVKIVFINCSFTEWKIEDNLDGVKNVSFDFSNCRFINIIGSNLNINKCYIAGADKNAIEAEVSVFCKDSYFADICHEASETIVDLPVINGLYSKRCKNLIFENCRWEVPVSKTTTPKAKVESVICLDPNLSQKIENCRFSNCYINGGTEHMLTLKGESKIQHDLKIEKAHIGYHFQNEDKTQYANEAIKPYIFNSIIEKYLFVSDVQKNGSKSMRFVVNNITQYPRVLKIYSNLGVEQYDIRGLSKYTPHNFSDYPHDIDYSRKGNYEWVTFYDEDVQIRHVNFIKRENPQNFIKDNYDILKNKIEFTSEIRDDIGFTKRSDIVDLAQQIMTGKVEKGFRDLCIIPDTHNTGPEKGIEFKIFPEGTDNIGTIPEGVTGSLLRLTRTKDRYAVNGYSNGDLAKEVLIENYDFSQAGFIFLNDGILQEQSTIIFKNCKFLGISMCGGRMKTVFDHCQFDGNTSAAGTEMKNCYFHTLNSDGINADSHVYIHDSYVADLNREPDPSGVHIDGIQIFGYKNHMLRDIHLKNVRFSLPGFYYDGSGRAYVNSALMFQQEYSEGMQDITFEDCIIDMAGIHPCFSTQYFNTNNLMFKNIVVADEFCGRLFPPNFNEDTKTVDMRASSDMYVSSIWVEKGDTHVMCTNSSSATKKNKNLRIVTNRGVYEYEIPRSPDHTELMNDKYYQTYTFKDMPYNIDITLPGGGHKYVICYDGDKQIRYENLENKANTVPVQTEIYLNNYESALNKPSINGTEISGELGLYQIYNSFGALSQDYHDINIIPDLSNCGLINSEICNKIIPPNTGSETHNQDYCGAYFELVDDEFFLDFKYSGWTGPSSNGIRGDMYFEDVDFTKCSPKGNFGIIHSNLQNLRNVLRMHFKNCKVNSFYVADGGEENIFYEFENCQLQSIKCQKAIIKNCLIKGASGTLAEFGKETYAYNSYFCDNHRKTEVQGNEKLDGLKITSAKKVKVENCRFDLPVLNLSVSNGIPGSLIHIISDVEPIKYPSPEEKKYAIYKPKYDLQISHCYFNGGKDLITLEGNSSKDIKISNCTFGMIHPDCIKYNPAEVKGLTDKIIINQVPLISEIKKESNGITYITATNSTNRIKNLKIQTDGKFENINLLPVEDKDSYEIDTKTFDDLLINKKYPLVNRDNEYIVIYDDIAKVRFINNSNEAVFKEEEKKYIVVDNEEVQTYNLRPDKMTYFSGKPLTDLTISLAPEGEQKYSEYSCEFITSAAGCNLSIPVEFKWNGDKIPTLESNKKYQLVLFSGTAYISGGVAV